MKPAKPLPNKKQQIQGLTRDMEKAKKILTTLQRKSQYLVEDLQHTRTLCGNYEALIKQAEDKIKHLQTTDEELMTPSLLNKIISEKFINSRSGIVLYWGNTFRRTVTKFFDFRYLGGNTIIFDLAQESYTGDNKLRQKVMFYGAESLNRDDHKFTRYTFGATYTPPDIVNNKFMCGLLHATTLPYPADSGLIHGGFFPDAENFTIVQGIYLDKMEILNKNATR